MTRNIIFFTVFIAILMGISGNALAISYFGYEEWGGSWHDANKTAANTDDDLLCWAAAASNILDWANWITPESDTETAIFQEFQAHWTDNGGLMSNAWQWWFDGTEPSGGASVDVSGGGNYFSDYNFYDYYFEAWSGDLMSSVDNYLRSGYGVTLGVTSEYGGHALTVWGFDYDNTTGYTSIYVTDSDDYKWGESGLQSYNVLWDDTANQWGLGGIYDGWHIDAVMALAQNPGGSVNPGEPTIPEPTIPEPATILLFSSGLIGIAGFRKLRIEK